MHSTRRQHSSHQHGSQNGASLSVRHSPITSGGINDHYPSTTYNRETQRAILSALTKLQRDLHNISERLNRLETTANLLQQVRSFFLSFSYSTRKSFLETIIFLSRTAGKCSRPHRPINDRVYFLVFLQMVSTIWISSKSYCIYFILAFSCLPTYSIILPCDHYYSVLFLLSFSLHFDHSFLLRTLVSDDTIVKQSSSTIHPFK